MIWQYSLLQPEYRENRYIAENQGNKSGIQNGFKAKQDRFVKMIEHVSASDKSWNCFYNIQRGRNKMVSRCAPKE